MIAIEEEIIREAQEADVGRVLQMGRRFLCEGPYKDQLSDKPEVAEALIRKLLEGPSTKILVAQKNGRIVGVIAFVIFPHYFSGEITAGELIWYVEPEDRKGGIALKLMWEAEKVARILGAMRMQFTAPTSEVGEIYKRFGYRQIEVSYQKELFERALCQ